MGTDMTKRRSSQVCRLSRLITFESVIRLFEEVFRFLLVLLLPPFTFRLLKARQRGPAGLGREEPRRRLRRDALKD